MTKRKAQSQTVCVKDAGKKGSGLFSETRFRSGQVVTQFGLPNFVRRIECGMLLAQRQEWWDCFSHLNSLPIDNVIFLHDGLVYDFQPPGEDGNVWYFINHSSKSANVEPVWENAQLVFRATKNIPKGAEILFQYNNIQTVPSDWEDD